MEEQKYNCIPSLAVWFCLLLLHLSCEESYFGNVFEYFHYLLDAASEHHHRTCKHTHYCQVVVPSLSLSLIFIPMVVTFDVFFLLVLIPAATFAFCWPSSAKADHIWPRAEFTFKYTWKCLLSIFFILPGLWFSDKSLSFVMHHNLSYRLGSRLLATVNVFAIAGWPGINGHIIEM